MMNSNLTARIIGRSAGINADLARPQGWRAEAQPARYTDGRFCEGFQMPAVTNIPHGQRPASENLQGTKPREGVRIRRCPRAHYGDLGVGEPQLSQPRGSVER